MQPPSSRPTVDGSVTSTLTGRAGPSTTRCGRSRSRADRASSSRRGRRDQRSVLGSGRHHRLRARAVRSDAWRPPAGSPWTSPSSSRVRSRTDTRSFFPAAGPFCSPPSPARAWTTRPSRPSRSPAASARCWCAGAASRATRPPGTWSTPSARRCARPPSTPSVSSSAASRFPCRRTWRGRTVGGAHYAVSASGALAYVKGGGMPPTTSWCGWTGRAARSPSALRRDPTSTRVCRRTGRGSLSPCATRSRTSGSGISSARPRPGSPSRRATTAARCGAATGGPSSTPRRLPSGGWEVVARNADGSGDPVRISEQQAFLAPQAVTADGAGLLALRAPAHRRPAVRRRAARHRGESGAGGAAR